MGGSKAAFHDHSPATPDPLLKRSMVLAKRSNLASSSSKFCAAENCTKPMLPKGSGAAMLASGLLTHKARTALSQNDKLCDSGDCRLGVKVAFFQLHY